MSIDAIGAAVVSLVGSVSGISGVTVVYDEQPWTLDRDAAAEGRVAGDRVHFWHVYTEPEEVAGGIGYNELRHRVTVEGFLGVARDAPQDGVKSDVTARNLLNRVRAALSAAANMDLSGSALGSERVVCERRSIVPVRVDRETHPCHRMAVSYVVMEDA